LHYKPWSISIFWFDSIAISWYTGERRNRMRNGCDQKECTFWRRNSETVSNDCQKNNWTKCCQILYDIFIKPLIESIFRHESVEIESAQINVSWMDDYGFTTF